MFLPHAQCSMPHVPCSPQPKHEHAPTHPQQGMLLLFLPQYHRRSPSPVPYMSTTTTDSDAQPAGTITPHAESRHRDPPVRRTLSSPRSIVRVSSIISNCQNGPRTTRMRVLFAAEWMTALL